MAESINTTPQYTNMKVKRPVATVAEAPVALPSRNGFKDQDATKKMQQINSDIYEGYKKEKANHEFNLKLFSKIFIGIALGILSVKGIRKLIQLFKR